MDSIVFDYSRLNGKIKEKYGTQGNFAKVIRIGRTALSAKLNNKSDFSQKEMYASCDALGIARDEIPSYFFCIEVQKHELNCQ